MDRRHMLKGSLLGAAMLAMQPTRVLAVPQKVDVQTRFARLEQKHGGHLGVAILDTESGQLVTHRGEQRFLLCSTAKLLSVAAVLARVDKGEERLDRRMVFNRTALLDYAPVTRTHVGEPGMTIGEICRAAITVSDNTAANLLLSSLGGPAAVTAFVRSLGDTVTRTDRTEPSLNVGSPGDLRDTTTPLAMLQTMQKILLGNRLSPASTQQLYTWLRATSTGVTCLRAGLPSNWQVGDKTGSGSQKETNDVAIAWRPKSKPLLITAYYAGSTQNAVARHAVLAEVGRIAATL